MRLSRGRPTTKRAVVTKRLAEKAAALPTSSTIEAAARAGRWLELYAHARALETAAKAALRSIPADTLELLMKERRLGVETQREREAQARRNIWQRLPDGVSVRS